MWQRASLGNAQQRLTAMWRRTAAHVTARSIGIVLLRVAAVLFALQLVYLIAGNAAIKSQLIRKAVSGSEGFELDYASAYTLWPGHVHVEQLALRVEDYNVQFEVALGSAEVDISLSQLLFKKFRVTRLDASETRFRLRHKLIVVGDDAERIAAYPPIKGFADPPYFVGVRPPPTPPEAARHLWQVRIENVTARVTELWVMEHRFVGEGVARGSFVVLPARWVQVEPAELTLERGTLRLGQHVVADEVRGKITCDIPDMWVQKTDGVDVLGEIAATIRLDLGKGKLDFLRAYLARFAELGYGGDARWSVDVNLQRGVIQQGSRVLLAASPLRVSKGELAVEGDVAVRLARDAQDTPDQLRLMWSAPLIRASRNGSRDGAPQLEGLHGSLALNAVDLRGDLSLGEARVALARAVMPSLGWFQVPGMKLAGSAQTSFDLSRNEAGQVSGRAKLSLNGARLEHGRFAAQSDLNSQLALSRDVASDAPWQMDELNVAFTRTKLRDGDKQSEMFAGRLDASGLQILLEPTPTARGAMKLHVSPTAALLPLVVSAPVSGASDALFALRRLDAQASVRIGAGGIDVTRLEARDGPVRLRGHVSTRGADPRGAFLLSAGLFNVGVTLESGDTEVSPLVGGDWLGTTALRE
jgi:hypothetical protein